MRLIDAELLKKNISKWLNPSGDIQKTEMVMLDDIAISVIMEIEEQPTAYSVDKVVEELEQLKNKGSVTKTEKLITNACVNKAIEIVKQGGVSDDVCEWRQTSTARYKTSCGYNLLEFFDTKACYCKQCGKKIKVVE